MKCHKILICILRKHLRFLENIHKMMTVFGKNHLDRFLHLFPDLHSFANAKFFLLLTLKTLVLSIYSYSKGCFRQMSLLVTCYLDEASRALV